MLYTWNVAWYNKFTLQTSDKAEHVSLSAWICLCVCLCDWGEGVWIPSVGKTVVWAYHSPPVLLYPRDPGSLVSHPPSHWQSSCQSCRKADTTLSQIQLHTPWFYCIFKLSSLGNWIPCIESQSKTRSSVPKLRKPHSKAHWHSWVWFSHNLTEGCFSCGSVCDSIIGRSAFYMWKCPPECTMVTTPDEPAR